MQEQEFALLNIIEYAKREPDFRSTMNAVLKGIQRHTRFACVGIRIKNEIGDYPYFGYLGFSDDFIEEENTLCEVDKNGTIICDCLGNPVLQCMCGNVLRGRFNPDLPFFTKAGSFWSNSTTELLASTTEDERQSRTRNRCNGEGYESVGIFPMRYDAITVGLLQLNDHRKNMFSVETIHEYELAAERIASEVYSSTYFKHFNDEMSNGNS